MRAIRIIGVVGVVVGTLAIGTHPATAGGGGSYWKWGAAHAPGEIVETSADICAGVVRPRGKGPHFAYLASKNGFRWAPPGLPTFAAPLGRISLDTRGRGCHTASLTFNVPDVEPGHYVVIHCNRPCTHQLSGIVPTEFKVVASRSEAAAVRYAVRQDREMVGQVWHVIRREVNKRQRVEQDVRELAGRVTSLTTRIDSLRAAKPQVTESSAPVLEAVLSVIAIGGLLSAAMVLLVRRRTAAPGPNVQG